MAFEKPEPNAYWHEKHGWITGLPSVNDPDYGKEVERKAQQLDKAAKEQKKKDRSGPRIAKKMMTDPNIRNIYSDTDEEGNVILPTDTCGGGTRGGSFSHGNGNCGCLGC